MHSVVTKENILENQMNDRLDSIISRIFNISRNTAASLIKQGKVRLNSLEAKKSDRVKIGDSLDILAMSNSNTVMSLEDIKIKVIYENERYAIINKPYGIPVHYGAGHSGATIVDGILKLWNITDDDPLTAGIVHRLDKDTSGLLIVTKDMESKKIFKEMFRDGSIDKWYYAIAEGKPNFKRKIVSAPIGKSLKQIGKMIITETGKDATSEIDVIGAGEDFFLAEVKILTGRTHQIRVHMRHINHPILGDKVYGFRKKRHNLSRHALHAHRLRFIDPFTSENMDINIPPPDDMRDILGDMMLLIK